MNSRILPILGLMIAVGMFFAYVSPTWTGSIATTKAAIASDDKALAAAANYVAQEKELTDQRNAIDPANLTRLETFLPDSVDNVGLILDLNAVAARSGLALSNVDVTASAPAAAPDTTASGGPPAEDTLAWVDMSLSASGTYSALKSFLSGVEKSVRLLDVKDISIVGSDTGVYVYHMSIRIYWLH